MPTAYMLITLPVEGGSDDLWDSLLNEALELRIDGHRHITGEGRPIPVAGLNIDANLSIAGFSITNAASFDFTNGSLLASGSYRLFVSGGNAYFRNGSGFNVPITIGNALAMTTAGGFAGQYTSVSAEAAFIDASDSYTFKQQIGAAVRQYAMMESADLRMYEFKAHPAAAPPTTYVGLRSPAALASSYSLTFPGALPGSTLLQQVSAAGLISWSNTIANAVTLSALLTASLGITLAANQDITLPAGTGRLKQATDAISFPAQGTVETPGSAAWDYSNHYCASTAATRVVIRVALPAFTKVTQVEFEIYGNGVCSITANAVRVDAAGVNSVASASSTPAAAWVTLTINNAALEAAFTIVGQTFSGLASLLLMYEFSATGGRVRRVRITTEKV